MALLTNYKFFGAVPEHLVEDFFPPPQLCVVYGIMQEQVRDIQAVGSQCHIKPHKFNLAGTFQVCNWDEIHWKLLLKKVTADIVE